MAHTIEILIKDKSPQQIEEKDRSITDFIKYLDEKYPTWDEFVITSRSNKPLRLVKSKDRLIQLPKTLAVGNLLVHLDRHYKDWSRFGMSRVSFPVIAYEDCQPGMLVRPSSSNTNMYFFVKEETINSQGEKEISGNQEGNFRTFNTVSNSAYQFALLSTEIPESDFEEIDWLGIK